MNQLISVIVPVLNREDKIEECIRSVFAQSYQNWELLIIDNGSTDRTFEICQTLAEDEPKIRLLNAPRGVSNARNAGLEAAQGKYLFFLDSDDVIHPALLETLLNAMERHHAGLGGTPINNILEQQWHTVPQTIQKDTLPGQTHFLPNTKAVHAIFRYTTPINMVGGVMMLRSLVGETRFRTDLHIGEDFYFIYENLIKGTDVIFLKNKWYYCRIHNSNQSLDCSYQGFCSRFERRRLVWQQEEHFGRTENGMLQKKDALYSYIYCLKQNKRCNLETAQMKQKMRSHRTELLSGLNIKTRMLYDLSVYFPRLYLFIFSK